MLMAIKWLVRQRLNDAVGYPKEEGLALIEQIDAELELEKQEAGGETDDERGETS